MIFSLPFNPWYVIQYLDCITYSSVCQVYFRLSLPLYFTYTLAVICWGLSGPYRLPLFAVIEMMEERHQSIHAVKNFFRTTVIRKEKKLMTPISGSPIPSDLYRPLSNFRQSHRGGGQFLVMPNTILSSKLLEDPPFHRVLLPFRYVGTCGNA